jgi:hypothetical protein
MLWYLLGGTALFLLSKKEGPVAPAPIFPEVVPASVEALPAVTSYVAPAFDPWSYAMTSDEQFLVARITGSLPVMAWQMPCSLATDKSLQVVVKLDASSSNVQSRAGILNGILWYKTATASGQIPLIGTTAETTDAAAAKLCKA